MIKPINMPKYGLQQDEGTIIEWKKQEGDRVEKGDILLEVETDKAVFEYEAPENGYLRHILAQDGAVVPVLSPIAVLTDELDETVDLDAFTTPEPTASAEAAAPQIEASIPESTQAAQTSTHSNRIKRSPAARHRARELDIDLSTVTGTGPGGRIVKADIERTAASPPPVSAGSSALSKMRQAIGKTMAFSKSTIPHFYVGIEIDMTDAEAWRKSLAQTDDIKLSVTDLFIKATAEALTQYPVLNSSLEGDTHMVIHDTVNIGLAVGTDDGLVVPVIPNAQKAFLSDLADIRAKRVNDARAGKLHGDASATFTISNLGMFGVSTFTAIVNPPEAAILAIGAAIPRVVPVGDPLTIAVRHIADITLSADHRLVDGVVAAQFLQALKQSLEDVKNLERWL
jgi:pyruvate dehydrogenase E2 component (dihydrolipoamide acetyltransferase)